MNPSMVGVIPRKDEFSGFDEHSHLHIIMGNNEPYNVIIHYSV
jgi:hypothetical protein